MKKILLLTYILVGWTTAFSQPKIVAKIKEAVVKNDAETHLTFLASDEMRGRGTGSPEIAIASNYIAAQFKLAGVKTIIASSSYFQEVALQQMLQPKTMTLKLGHDAFVLKDDLYLLKGKSITSEAEIVFVGYGSEADLDGVDVKGKIVACFAGSPENSNTRMAYLKDSPLKYKLVQQKGGIALVEIVAFPGTPWQMISGYFAGARTSLAPGSEESNEMPQMWLRKSDAEGLNNLIQQKSAMGSLSVEANSLKSIPGRNVVGVIEGTDPKLKQEYVVLSAHYDHVGVQKNNSPDSIYNGARDNAIGVTAIIEAAKFLSKNPPKRSVLLITFCAEEKGMLGSKWYSDHPVVPLNQTVFNLNCDGAGYNDKTIISLVDLNRTTTDELLKAACESVGLALRGDPAPDQNLYERSDNYSFAVKGVPSVNISPGVKGFDQEMMKYYHQPPDEASSLDFDYLEKFYRAFVYAATLVSNSASRPSWKQGDKFEEAGKKLYGIK